MKTFEGFKIKEKLFGIKDKKEKTYREVNPQTLEEILNRFGGVNRFDLREVILYLDLQYKNKYIRFKFDNNVHNKFITKITITIEKREDVVFTTFLFYFEDGKATVGLNAILCNLVENKEYNPNDPFDEEEWDS